MFHITGRVVALFVLFVASPSLAKVIDFELPKAIVGPTYEQDGFVLHGGYNYTNSFGNWLLGGRPAYNVNGNNATIYQVWYGDSTTITTNDGSNFDFYGISLARVIGGVGNGTVNFLFFRNGVYSRQDFRLRPTYGLQKYGTVETGVSAVTFYLTNPDTDRDGLQFDFANLSKSTGAVPEPATWALMLIGFGVIGYSTRRTRRRAMRMQAV